MYETICSPVDYGGLTLKNRVIFAPTSRGLPRAELLARMEAIAAGGCAMIVVGDVPVLPGRSGLSLFSRQLIADPDWPRKVAEGRAADIRRCVRCNQQCLGGMMAHQGVHCIYERKD